MNTSFSLTNVCSVAQMLFHRVVIGGGSFKYLTENKEIIKLKHD